ncbi:MAG: hypothetical protein HND56_02960 [Pseudomonadota bacterium]|nr:hypothetical protein [Pseudomonadota bacterium]QKK04708.1 MAG: hypothetical protein HND56_02960 [Pseudomonadota bacterium]
MKLTLTEINTQPCEFEQRFAWSFQGVVGGHDISFNFFDSGNNAAYMSLVTAFDYTGPLEDRAMLEEAIEEWFYENEHKTDLLRSGDMIKLDIKSTSAYHRSPRAMSDHDLVTKLRENARDCLETANDNDAFRNERHYAEKKSALPPLLREARTRIEKRGLSAHFRLQNLAPFLRQVDENSWTEEDAIGHLAQIKNADMPAATMRQSALRNYLRRNKS